MCLRLICFEAEGGVDVTRDSLLEGINIKRQNSEYLKFRNILYTLKNMS